MAKKATLTQVKENILNMADEPEELKKYLDKAVPLLKGPTINSFSPRKGYPGTLMEIEGENFSKAREENDVLVGGKYATVVQSDQSRLKVITSPEVAPGPVEVNVGGKRAKGPYDFQVTERPNPEEDGPPVVFAGRELDGQDDLLEPGCLKVLFMLVYPSDRPPKDQSKARDEIVRTKEDLEKFYHQASFGRLRIEVDITKA